VNTNDANFWLRVFWTAKSYEKLLLSRLLKTNGGEWSRRRGAGAARGIRTPDPVITNDVLYQLSYCGEPCGKRVHLISGGAPVGKENAGSAKRNRCGFEADHSLIHVKEAHQGDGIQSGHGF
jgi:hypothetical protein